MIELRLAKRYQKTDCGIFEELVEVLQIKRLRKTWVAATNETIAEWEWEDVPKVDLTMEDL